PYLHILHMCSLGPPPRSTLFPYPTLFRSEGDGVGDHTEMAGTVADLLGHPVQVGRRVGAGDHEPGLEAGEIPRLRRRGDSEGVLDRKSTRLNSSHVKISYAVFCLKKKTK